MFNNGKKYFIDEKNSLFGNMMANLLTIPISAQMSKAISPPQKD